MTIRAASNSDLDSLVELNGEIHALHIELFPDIYKKTDRTALVEWLRDRIKDESTYFFVFEEKASVVGYIISVIVTRDENPFQYERRFAYIDQICVSSKRRRKGIGRTLVDHTIEKIKATGITQFELDVRSNNLNAKDAFDHMGFTTVTERKVYART